jgi:ParB-like chromosome segregation protein Spo0J
MEEDGFTQPIIVHKATMQIVDGEHRWRGAKAVGYKEVPVCFVDMTPEQMRISTLRHNRARGSEDMELTAQVLRDLQELGAVDWAQDSLMLSDAELNKLLEDVPVSEALAAETHSEAWTPDSTAGDGARAADGTAGREGADSFGGDRLSGMTEDAATKLREREKRIAEAKTEEERQQVAQDTAIYRLALVFTNEQARIIKAALGSAPAVNLLAICTDHLKAKNPEGLAAALEPKA